MADTAMPGGLAAAGSRPAMAAFLSLGFRPLYMAGCAWALISIAVWIFAPGLVRPPMWGLAWHAHEMLWGFIATIAVGFLFTASNAWTGINPLKGGWLGMLCLLWLLARAGYLLGGEVAFWLAMACETAFFLLASLCVLRVVVKKHSTRNYGLPMLLAGLCAANVLYLLAARQGNYVSLMHYFEQGLLCMAVIALLIARRVIPFFSMRMVPGLQIPMLAGSGKAQMVLGVAAIAASLAGLRWSAALALAATGIIALWQLARWKPLSVLHKPMLWILYLGYVSLAVGLIWAAAYTAGLTSGPLSRAATHVHIIGVGGFSVLIIGMVTRTALGHLGRPLALDRSMLASYYLMIAAAVLRLAALWPSTASVGVLHAAALCWMASMALYLWRFVPMLIRPRPDAQLHRPAAATQRVAPVIRPGA